MTTNENTVDVKAEADALALKEQEQMRAIQEARAVQAEAEAKKSAIDDAAKAKELTKAEKKKAEEAKVLNAKNVDPEVEATAEEAKARVLEKMFDKLYKLTDKLGADDINFDIDVTSDIGRRRWNFMTGSWINSRISVIEEIEDAIRDAQMSYSYGPLSITVDLQYAGGRIIIT